MKTLYAILFALVCVALLGTTAWGQAVGDYGSAGSATWATVANWIVCTSPGTWVGATAAPGVPTTSTNVWIRNGHTVTVEASSKNCKNLTIESGGTLVSSGTNFSSAYYITTNGTTIQADGTFGDIAHALGLNVKPGGGGGGTITIQGSGSICLTRIRPSTGTANTTIILNANLTMNYNNGSVLYAQANDGTVFTINSGKTVSVVKGGFVGVSTNSSGDATSGANFTLNIYGTLTLQDSASDVVNLGNTSGKTTTLAVYSGGILNLGSSLLAPSTGAGTINVIDSAGGLITFNGTSGSITCDIGKATTTINGTFDFGTCITSTRNLGTATVNGTLRFEDGTWPSGSVTLNSGSTVEYYGGSGISLGSTPTTYYNLLINNSSGVTLGGSCNVTNALTLNSGTFTVGANTLTLNNPILGTPANLSAGSSSSISIAGSASGVNIPSSVTSLSNLTLNNTNGTTLQGNLTLNGALTFTSGSVVTGSNTLAIATGGSVSGAGAGQYVYGNLQRAIPSSASVDTFYIGDNANYTPVALSFGGGTTAGNLTVNTTGNTQPNFASSTINQTKYVKRYWTFTNSGVSGTYDATFNFVTGDIQGGGNPSNFVVGKYDGGWAYPTFGTRTSTSTQATGMTSFSDFAIGEGATPPTVNTPAYSAVAKDTAILGATIASDNGATVTASGVAYATSPAPTTPTAATSPLVTSGLFTVNVNGLSSNTLYYFRGYATNSAGTGYSADNTFTTLPNAPVAAAASSIGGTGFTANWSAVSGSVAVTYRLDVSTTNLFTTCVSGDSDIAAGSGTSYAVSGLSSGTTYYYRVRAVNTGGTSDNSSPITVVTLTLFTPTVTALTASSIVDTSATLGANVTSDGGAAVTERGIVWSTSLNPTIADNKVTTTGTTGAFTVHVGSLSPKTLIHYRGYATNSVGPGYTTDTTIYTLATEPATHAGSFTATAVSKSEIDLSWSAATGADGYIILKHAGVDPSGLPVDATGYVAGAIIGTDTVAAVITSGATTTANITGLATNTHFHFSIIPFGYDGSHAATYNYKTDGTIPTANAITFSNLSDVIATPGFVYPTNIPYMNYPPTAGLTTANSDSVFGITVRDGGSAVNDSDALPTILTALSLTVTNFSMIDHAALFDGSTNLAEVAVSGSPINFSALNVSVPDNGTKDLMLRVVFKTAVTDNARMTFTVSSVTASATGSGFAAANGGGATSSTSGNDNKVAVTASKLVFTTQPTSGKLPTVNFGPVVVAAKDANNNVDVDYSTAVVISSSVFKLYSTDSLGLTHTPVSGVATWANMRSLTAGAAKIAATSNGLTPDSSSSFTVLGTGDFRTHQAGNWNDVTTWERFDGTNWVNPAPSTPVDSLGRKTILSGHSVTVTADLAADSVYVNGTLTINSGVTFTVNPPSLKKERYGIITDTSGGAIPAVIISGTYKLNRDSGNVPNATWNDGSTLLVTGSKTATSIGANPGQSYYNIVWNCPSQGANANMGMHPPTTRDTTTTVRGDITILNTGNGAYRAYLCGPPAGSDATHRTVARININGKINVSNKSIFSAHGTGNAYTDVYVTVLGNITVRDSASQLSISRGSQAATGTTTWYIKSDSVIYGPYTNNQNSSDAATSTATSRGKFIFNKAGTQIVALDTLVNWTGPCNMQFGDSSTSTTVNIGNSPFIGSGCVQRIKYNAKVIVGSLGYIGGGSNSASPPAPSNFAMDNGATLVIGPANGIRATGSSGAVRVSGARTYSTGGNYEYNGTAAQKTGSGLPSAVNNLTVTNAAGVTMDSTSAVTVNGTLTFNNGTFTTGIDSLHSDTLALAATASVNRISGHVVGNLRRGINSSWNGVQKTFDIGDTVNYTPVNLTFGTVSGAGSLTANTTPAEQPNIATSNILPAKSVNRYYSFTNNGVGFDNYNAAFKFVPGDLVGSPNKSNFIVGKYDGGTWSYPTVGVKTDSTTQATGLTSFSDFALGEPTTYTITSAVTGGTITPLGSVTVHNGSDTAFTFAPFTGYHLVNVLVDAVHSDSTSGYTFRNVVNNHTINVSYAINMYTLTVDTVGRGSVTKNPDSTQYTHGTMVQLTAVPALGYNFVNWTGDATGSDNPLSVTMDKIKSITAHFALNTYTLTVDTVGRGRVVRSPNLAAYDSNSTVHLTAVPSTGYHFVNWTDSLTGTHNPDSIVMNSNKVVTAHFAINTYSLTVNAAHGTVTLNPPTGPYDSATVVHLTAIPATGYHLVNWLDSLSGTQNPDSIVMNSDKVVTAHFAIDTYGLTINATHGTVTLLPATGPYDSATVVHLTAVPATGYHFVNWTDSLTGSHNPDSIVMNSNKVVTANFAIDTHTLTVHATHGTVTVTPPSGPYDYGTIVHLNAVPAVGYHFVNWTDSLTGAHNPDSIAMNTDKVVTANFAINQYALTTPAVGGGTVGKNPDQSLYDHGTSVVLTATPNDRSWKFSAWSGDTSSATNPITVLMDSAKSITATFVRDSAYLYAYRTFRPDSIANAGVVTKAVVPTVPNNVEFAVTVVNESTNVGNLHMEFADAVIDSSLRPFTINPPATKGMVSGSKGAKWDFAFVSPIGPGTSVTVSGWATTTKAMQKVTKYRWMRGQTKLGKTDLTVLATDPRFTVNQLHEPMPNIINVLSQAYNDVFNVGNGKTDSSGMTIGVRVDSLKADLAWVTMQTYAKLTASLYVKPYLQTGTPRGLDFKAPEGVISDTTKASNWLKGTQKTLSPKATQSNALFGNLVALKLSIGASYDSITPVGLGELVYDDGTLNPLNGMHVKDIALKADTLMTGYVTYRWDTTWNTKHTVPKLTLVRIRNFADYGTYLNLSNTIYSIDTAFQGPMDTLSFSSASGLMTKGTRRLVDVGFLRSDPNMIPAKNTRPRALVTAEIVTPVAYTLYQNYPNPFNPTTTIRFDLPQQAVVTLKIYNILGQEVATLFDRQQMDNGTQEVQFNASRFASGVYFYRMIAEGMSDDGVKTSTFMTVKKMLLLK